MNLKTGEFIEGPCKSVNEIISQFNCVDVAELFAKEYEGINQIALNDNKINLSPNNELIKEDIYKGPRIGLSDKYPEYKNLEYRYATNIKKIKKNRKTFIPV